MKLLLYVLITFCQANEIKYQNKVLVPDAKTKCEIIFHDMAIVAMFCPDTVKPADMIEDFKKIEKSTSWPMPIFEVFNDLKKAPKSLKEYNSLPDRVSYQTYSLQIQNGQITEKECYKKAKTINCKF